MAVKIVARLALLLVFILAALVLVALVIIPPDHSLEREGFPHLTGPYLGQTPPGRRPQPFAAGIVPDDLHTAPVFSPAGDQVYWRASAEEPNEIEFMRLEDGRWTVPKVVPFASRFFGSGDPCFSPDGQKLFFSSWRPLHWYQPADILERYWYVERRDDGWSKPQPVGETINEMDLHWQLSASSRGTLCFASQGDIYCASWEGGVYGEPRKLAAPVNTSAGEGHPFIAPDESYLIFASNGHPNSMGDYDLYISRKRPDGSWVEPINLGPEVNSSTADIYPTVSPDGKYLFFLRHHVAYWVDFALIESIAAPSG